MNKLLNPDGGVPLKLTDLVYMQSATFDAFKSLLNAFSKGTGNVRLAGCVVSKQSQTVSWTAGFIGINGEVYPVTEGSIETSETLYWKITRIQEAQVTLENGQQAARRERSYASLVPESQKDDTSVKDEDLKDVTEFVKGIINPQKTDYMVSAPVDGINLVRISKIQYGDTFETFDFVAAASKTISLDKGFLCNVSGVPNNTFMYATISSLEGFIRACIVAVLSNKVYLYDMSGSPLTSLTESTIESI